MIYITFTPANSGAYLPPPYKYGERPPMMVRACGMNSGWQLADDKHHYHRARARYEGCADLLYTYAILIGVVTRPQAALKLEIVELGVAAARQSLMPGLGYLDTMDLVRQLQKVGTVQLVQHGVAVDFNSYPKGPWPTS